MSQFLSYLKRNQIPKESAASQAAEISPTNAENAAVTDGNVDERDIDANATSHSAESAPPDIFSEQLAHAELVPQQEESASQEEDLHQEDSASPSSAMPIPESGFSMDSFFGDIDREILAIIDESSRGSNAPRVTQNATNDTSNPSDISDQLDEQNAIVNFVVNIPLAKLILDREQPRRLIPQSYYDKCLNKVVALVDLIKHQKESGDRVAQYIYDEIESLARNIELYGLIHPIMVIPAGENYLILHGERRALAFALLFTENHSTFAEIPAILQSNTQDADYNMLLQLSENLARSDLPAIRIAHLCSSFYTAAYNKIRAQTPFLPENALNMQALEKGFADMIRSTGIRLSQRTFAEYLRVLAKINPSVHQMLSTINASWEIIVALSRIPQDKQTTALQEYINNGKIPAATDKKNRPAWERPFSQIEKFLSREDMGNPEFVQALLALRQSIDEFLSRHAVQ